MTFTHMPKREIPEIKQIKVDDVRHYETPDGTFMSITSLLKNTRLMAYYRGENLLAMMLQIM